MKTATDIPFRYTDPVQTVFRFELDPITTLLIVGDPDNASYEWVFTTQQGPGAWSNDGYGSVAAALRDALNHYLD